MKIVLIDDDSGFLGIMRDALSLGVGFEVVGTADDGPRGLGLIKDLEPDVVLMDITMPRLSGLGVLEKLQVMPIVKRPLFIIISAFGEEMTMRIAYDLGADFYMIKPVNLEELMFDIRYFHEYKGKEAKQKPKAGDKTIYSSPVYNIKFQITNLIKALGMPTHIKGYDYVIFGLSILHEDLTAIHSLTKSVYSVVAQEYGTTYQRVERVIRNAIELTWNRGNFEMQQKLFGPDRSDNKPSNSEFFTRLAVELRE